MQTTLERVYSLQTLTKDSMELYIHTLEYLEQSIRAIRDQFNRNLVQSSYNTPSATTEAQESRDSVVSEHDQDPSQCFKDFCVERAIDDPDLSNSTHHSAPTARHLPLFLIILKIKNIN